jgi:hypothetical protein
MMIGFIISLLFGFTIVFLLNGNGSIMRLEKDATKTFIYFRRVICGIIYKKGFTARKLRPYFC